MAYCTFRPQSTCPAPAVAKASAWQAVLGQSVGSAAELGRLVGLDPAMVAEAERAAGGFPVLVPRPFLDRIRPGDPGDPLLLQVLPQAAELAAAADFGTDPVGEANAACCPGLLAKYHGRSLMVTTGACAVHCRFCFRRHFAYRHIPRTSSDWEPALRQIAADGSIREVILSGGDPLSLPDEQLSEIAGRLAEIPQLTRLRLHTRLPVLIPQRVTDELLDWLRRLRLATLVVVHVNHPAEIDAAVAAALSRLVAGGIPVLSQGVLLRGINDDAQTLAELYSRLADLRVMPYYLHQLDRVAGAAHFEVPVATGLRLIAQLRARLPGYAVPRYVREVAGGASKEVLA